MQYKNHLYRAQPYRLHSPCELSHASSFKSYEELASRLSVVLGDGSSPVKNTAESVNVKSNVTTDSIDTGDDSDSKTSGGDDALSYFEQLASED